MSRLLSVEVTREDRKVERSRSPLWAYGLGYLASVSGRSRATVAAAGRSGVNLGDPVEAVAWTVSRTRPLLADQLLEALGREPRYRTEPA